MSYPIEGADYWIRYVNLPPKIYAFVYLNDDGTFIIALDPRRSFEQQLDDYTHELMHILRDDLYSDLPVSVIEAA